ncbi:hypothetical protein AKO1_012653 [Acrasis kona]|uniref:Integrase catalytic domain-containing protein n=1 Tax=Acrasis kona TaxID=1008807 RepID=A0AAW2ZHH0_9EUKA
MGYTDDMMDFSEYIAHITSNIRVVRSHSITEPAERTPEWEDAVLESAHSMGHFGANIMHDHITTTLEITGIKDLKRKCLNFCKKCHVCRKVNNYRLTYSPLKRPIMRSPGEYIHCDILYMEKDSQGGHKYVIVVVDDFTKFVWLRATVSKSAKDVALFLLEIFTQFGFPSTLRSDEGKEFSNSLVANICQLGNVNHMITIPHFHSGNGRVERQNRTITDSVLKLTDQLTLDTGNPRSWHTVLPMVQLVLNARIHTTLKATPFSLMLGRQPFSIKVPETDDFITLDESSSRPEDVNHMINFWNTFKSAVIKQAYQIKLKGYDKAVKTYKHKIGKFLVGELVKWKIPPGYTHNHKNTKFLGPFRVKSIDINGNYLIESQVEEFHAPAQFLASVDTRIKNKKLNPDMRLPEVDKEELFDEFVKERFSIDEDQIEADDDEEISEVGVDDEEDASYNDNDEEEDPDDHNIKPTLVRKRRNKRNPKK